MDFKAIGLALLVIAALTAAALSAPLIAGGANLASSADLEALYGLAGPTEHYDSRVAKPLPAGVTLENEPRSARSGSSAPSVAYTLVMPNNTLLPGNFNAATNVDPTAIAYDAAQQEFFIANYESDSVGVVSEATNSLVATVDVGSSPYGIAYDSAKGDLFVADSGSNNVTVLSANTNGFLANISVGEEPSAIAYASGVGELYVANEKSDSVSVINDTTDSVVVAIGVGSAPDGLAYDGENSQVYVANSNSNNVSVISTTQEKVVANVNVSTSPFGVVYDSGLAKIFVADSGSKSVSVISTHTDQLLTTIPVGALPYGLAYDQGNGQIIVANYFSDNVSVISDSDDAVVASIDVGSLPLGVAVDSPRGEAYVVNEGSSTVSVISDLTNTVVATIPLEESPQGVAYDTAKGEAFVAEADSNSVSVISNTTDTTLANVSVGSSPWGVAYDSGKGKIFVTNYLSDSVSVISDQNDYVLGEVNVGAKPLGIVYDSGKGEIFVANYASSNITVISDAEDNVIASINVSINPVALAYDSGTNEIFVADEGSNNVSVISDASNSVVANINIIDPERPTADTLPYGLAYDSKLNEVFVTDEGTKQVSVISDATNRVVAIINVGFTPVGIAYDSAANEVFVGNERSANVSVISDASNTVIASLPVGIDPFGLAYDPEDGYVYDTNLGEGTVSVISDGTVAPTLSAVTITPSSLTIDANRSQTFHASSVCAGGTCPGGVTYAWELTNSSAGSLNTTSGQSVTLVAGPISSSAALVATATLDGISRNDTAGITVVTSTTPTLTSVAIAPPSDTVYVGGRVNLSAALSCTGGPCPSGAVFTWSLNNTLGSLSKVSSPDTVFLAGGSGGKVEVNLIVFLDGIAKDSSSLITIASTAPPLESVQVTPPNDTLARGEVENFSASPSCEDGACLPGATYVWTLNNTLGSINSTLGAWVAFHAGQASGMVKLLVNATLNGRTVQGYALINITSGPAPTLTGLNVTPLVAQVQVGGSLTLNASASCSPDTCPPGVIISWTLSNDSLGSVVPTSGPTTTFIAGLVPGLVTVTATATMNGVSLNSSASLNITLSPPPVLSLVSISPGNETTHEDVTSTFTAVSECSGGPCPAGITYSWSLSSDLGSLSSKVGSSVSFTAGNSPGTVYLSVGATLDGKTIQSEPVNLTIVAPSSVPPTGFLGLPGNLGYYLVGTVASLVVLGVVVSILFRKSEGPANPEKKEAEGSPGSEHSEVPKAEEAE